MFDLLSSLDATKRVWIQLPGTRVLARVRYDSLSALRSMVRLSSKSADLNVIAPELALDAVLGLYSVGSRLASRVYPTDYLMICHGCGQARMGPQPRVVASRVRQPCRSCASPSSATQWLHCSRPGRVTHGGHPLSRPTLRSGACLRCCATRGAAHKQKATALARAQTARGVRMCQFGCGTLPSPHAPSAAQVDRRARQGAWQVTLHCTAIPGFIW